MTNTVDLSSELNRFEDALRRYAYRLTRNSGDAADLFQETAYRAIKGLHHFKAHTNIRSWLMTIMYNTFVNAYRKKKRMIIQQDDSATNYLLADTLANSVNNEGETKVGYDELQGIVRELDEPLRMAFVMAYEGYSYKEIAAKLEIPMGTVKSRVFQARRKLQRAVRQLYDNVGNAA